MMSKKKEIIRGFIPEVGKYYVFAQSKFSYFNGEILSIKDGVVNVRIVRSKRDNELIGDKGVSGYLLVISGEVVYQNLDKKRVVRIPVRDLHRVAC